MKKTDLKFGDKILVKGYITRHKIGNIRSWTRNPLPNAHIGIFLKYVTLADGTTEWETHGMFGEEGADYYFNSDKYIAGAWVCRKGLKPEKVFLSDCEKSE